MLFNSIAYLLFLPMVFILYWSLNRSHNLQNLMLWTAGCFFYACWDWRFVGLLLLSTIIDFLSGRFIYEAKSAGGKKRWLVLSVCCNLGFLGFFKYYDFFVDSFVALMRQIGWHPHLPYLHILLPVGISFYTFHGLSYVFDIYNGKIKPASSWINYSVFVSFFPLLVAGPIERASHLLPQIEKPRQFNYEKAIDGLRQILWGFFKKMVIADNCAMYVNQVFGNEAPSTGSNLFLGAILFSFQIYGDFSGYSDIALGSARLLGIDLLKNFNFPYFSEHPGAFWRRWHISLTSWFRDYLYIPLGGSRGSLLVVARNVFIVFVLSGLWHGASWGFIAWGLFHALITIPFIIRKRRSVSMLDFKIDSLTIPTAIKMLFTFLVVSLGWIFFRSDSLGVAVHDLVSIFSLSLFTKPTLHTGWLFLWIAFFLVMEWRARNNNHALEHAFAEWKKPFRWIAYYLILLSILYFGGAPQQFIYFRF